MKHAYSHTYIILYIHTNTYYMTKLTHKLHMQKSFVERARHVSVIFGANSPLYSHQYAHFLLKDIKNKNFISSRQISFLKRTDLMALTLWPKWHSPCFKAIYHGNQLCAGQAVTQHF